MDWIAAWHPLVQALVATSFTWFLTASGAACVFLFRSISRRVLDGMLGFAAGVMIAASFWSLLAPAIDLAEQLAVPGWIPAVVGFLLGGGFLWVVDKTLPHLHAPGSGSASGSESSSGSAEQLEGIPTSWNRSVLLVLAITLHNIPEGLAVGVAFGAVAAGLPGAGIAGAVALALGIGIQNFPEGMAVSVPLRREGLSRARSFLYGQLSGVVEPVAGVLGAVAVLLIRPLLPYALSFAAGAMIYVVVEELVPAAHLDRHGHVATIGAMLGFAVMMVLDVALG